MSRQYADVVPYWVTQAEKGGPAQALHASTGTAVPSHIGTIEYDRAGKPVGVAVMERGARPRGTARNVRTSPRLAPVVEYWREGTAPWAQQWATVFNTLQPGKRAFAVNT